MCFLLHLLDMVSWKPAELCSMECFYELGCVLAAQDGMAWSAGCVQNIHMQHTRCQLPATRPDSA